MPEKLLWTQQETETLDSLLRSRGYRVISREELVANRTRFSLQAPRPKKNKRNNPSRQYFFEPLHSFYAVKIVIGYSDDYPEGPNEKDSVKLVIFNKLTDEPVFKVTLNRTKRVISRAYNFGMAFAQVLKSLPVCSDPNCRSVYVFTQGNSVEDFPTCACPFAGSPGHEAPAKAKTIFELLNRGLSFHLFERYQKRRDRYAKKLASEGKEPGAREKAHKHWDKNLPADVLRYFKK